MKTQSIEVLFVVNSFPSPSQTFVLKQIEYLKANTNFKVSLYTLNLELGSVAPFKKNELHYSFDHTSAFAKLKSKFSQFIRNNNKFKTRVNKLNLSSEQVAITFPKQRFDVIISHFGPIGAIVDDLIKRKVINPTRHYCFIHGYDISRHHIVKEYYHIYKSMEDTTHFLAISNLWKNKLVDEIRLDNSRVSLHRMGIDSLEFNYSEPLEFLKKLKILSVARLTEKKGISFSLKAALKAKQKGIDVEFEIIGDGPDIEMYRNFINENKMNEYVKLSGRKDHSYVEEKLTNSHLFLLPSVVAQDGDMEGIPVSLMEAMAKGVLVLTTVHSGIPELVNNKNGFIVEEKNVDQLVEKIIEYTQLTHSDKIKIASNARETVLSEFDNKKWNEKLVELINPRNLNDFISKK